MNLFSVLENAAAKWPDDTALVHEGRTLRYVELYSAAKSLATAMLGAGIQAGDKVGIACPAGAEYIVAFFAVLDLGGIVVPISPALKHAEIRSLADGMALDVFCYSPQLSPLIPEGRDGKSTEVSIRSCSAPLCIRLASMRATPQAEREQLRRLNAASIGFSSGTTSTAKGMVLSHVTFIERAETPSEPPPICKDSKVLWLRSMDRVFPHHVTRCLLKGAEIFIANALALEPIRQLIAAHGIDQIYAGPMFFRMLNREGLTKEDLPSVEYCDSSGSSLPETVAELFRARFGREIRQTYGLNELGLVLANVSEETSKRGSVGKPVQGREVKLASLGPALSEREAVGEILVRGPGLLDAYYKPWKLRDEMLEDGWFRTGDVARRDADGYYWIVGRTKEVINVGGMKVFPYEVEEVLLSHPTVEEALVFGAMESRFGEVPRAKVKLRAGTGCTEKELLQYANERLSLFKSLRGLEFVDEIPKTMTGKPKRRA